jgi:hypothetical protein
MLRLMPVQKTGHMQHLQHLQAVYLRVSWNTPMAEDSDDSPEREEAEAMASRIRALLATKVRLLRPIKIAEETVRETCLPERYTKHTTVLSGKANGKHPVQMDISAC